jgi:hypothetical protein
MRTDSMDTPLFTLDGMVAGRRCLAFDDLIDRAVVDRGGRLRISLIDVLAVGRLGSDADLLLVEFDDRSRRALRVSEVLGHDAVSLQLHCEQPEATSSSRWRSRLWSVRWGPSPIVSSIHATTFAAFVRAR